MVVPILARLEHGPYSDITSGGSSTTMAFSTAMEWGNEYTWSAHRHNDTCIWASPQWGGNIGNPNRHHGQLFVNTHTRSRPKQYYCHWAAPIHAQYWESGICWPSSKATHKIPKTTGRAVQGWHFTDPLLPGTLQATKALAFLQDWFWTTPTSLWWAFSYIRDHV